MPEKDSILVWVLDEARDRRIQVRISTFVNVKIIVVGLVRKLGLPVVEWGDRPLVYSLWHRERQRALTQYENLAAARVSPGDVLELSSMFQALAGRSADQFDVSGPPVLVGEDTLRILPEPPPPPEPRPAPPPLERWVPLGLTVRVAVRKKKETRVYRRDKEGRLVPVLLESGSSSR